MSLLVSIRTEVTKAKRSAAFWVCLTGAGFIPAIFFIMYAVRPERMIQGLKEHPWESHFLNGWQSFAFFLLPLFVIMVCSLVPQIEFKNNTWKQVFASPQSFGNIFFSKYITILLMILFLFLMFNLFMFGNALLANFIHKKYPFFSNSVNWILLLKMNFKTFVALLGIISIQYWLSLRFRNFIVPIAIGLGLLIAAMILQSWEHIFKMPYAFSFISFYSYSGGEIKGPLLQNHEWNSIGYFIVFTLLAFLDMRYRKERG